MVVRSRIESKVNVAGAKADEVTAPELAVDRNVEHGEVAHPAFVLQAGPDGPDVLWLQRRLRPNDPANVPRDLVSFLI